MKQHGAEQEGWQEMCTKNSGATSNIFGDRLIGLEKKVMHRKRTDGEWQLPSIDMLDPVQVKFYTIPT